MRRLFFSPRGWLVFSGFLEPVVRTAQIINHRRFVIHKNFHGGSVGTDGSTATYKLEYRLKFVRLPLIPAR
jgi:hypothetical protein